MASKDGRVLHKSISLSTTLADLGDPTYILVATWLIPHCDDQGRLPADARQLKARVFPLIDAITPAIIASAVSRMATVGLIECYTADEVPLLQYRTWWKWNGGQRRSYPSQFPAPPGWQDRVRTWKDESAADCRRLPQPAVGRGRGTGIEETGLGLGPGDPAAPGGSALVTRADIATAYAAAFGVHGPLDAELLEAAMQTYPLPWIRRAILEAVAHSARAWRYSERILERWQQEGGPPADGGNGGSTAPDSERRAQLDARAAALRAQEEANRG